MAGFQLNLELDGGFAAVPEILNQAREQLDKAADRALKKTAQWLRTHSSREIAKALGIVQGPIRHRYKIYSRATAREVKLWVGLEPFSVHYLGSPKQTSKGVRVGPREYENAFISHMRSSEPMVWRRKGRERLPVEKVVEDWDGLAMTELERWERRTQQRFIELFEQEARHVFSAS